MAHTLRILLYFAAATASLPADPPFPIQFLGAVGEAGAKPVTLAETIHVTTPSELDIRFDGTDRAGKPWSLTMPRMHRPGSVRVWSGDLDHNAAQDLLIVTSNPAAAGCRNAGSVLALLFDNTGRPVPWTMDSKIPDSPATMLTDENRDNRAELTIRPCKGGRAVYQAQQARWVPLDPRDAPDPISGLDSTAGVRLERIISRTVGCRLAGTDACADLGHNRILYSEKNVRPGWPDVVIDAPAGRDIAVGRTLPALRELLERGYRLKLLGDLAHPAWLWADGTVPLEPADIVPVLDATPTRREPIDANGAKRLTQPDHSAIHFAPPNNAAAELLNAVPFPVGWLAQWRSATDTFYAVYDEDGTPITGRLDLDVPGDLVASDPDAGISFLTWRDDKPSELIHIGLAIAWERRLRPQGR